MAIEPGKSALAIEEIMEILPHRYPMLLVDKIEDIVACESAVGVKNVSFNEQFFQGHFPQKAVMPGVLIIEAMAQTAAAFTSYTEDLDVENAIVLFMGVDKARFRKPVVPGDRLELHVKTVQKRPPVWRFEGVAKVDGAKVADAQFAAMLSYVD
ncbi:MAG: 3-hydroxyacyl-ACP dehydratase FabZ [Pseudomonadota bacterium]